MQNKNKKVRKSVRKIKITDKPKEKVIITDKPKSRYPKISEIEQLSKILNKVQLEKKEITVSIEDESEIPVIRNIIKDAELKFELSVVDGKHLIKIIPGLYDFEKELDISDIDEEITLE